MIIRINNRPSVIRSPACDSFMWCDGEFHHVASREDRISSVPALRYVCPHKRGFKRTDCDFWFQIEREETFLRELE